MAAHIQIETYAFDDPRVGRTYGFLMHDPEGGRTLGFDAGQSRPMLDALEKKGWQLDELWITHHDFDHTDGVEEVKKLTGCVVTGPKHQTKPIMGLDRLVEVGDILDFAGYKADIMHMPGHTNDMLNYYFATLGVCFVGDVLFPLGCGRLKEGTPEEMWQSLQQLMQLPPETMLYACHEYAQGNAAFAKSIEPDYQKLQIRIEQIDALRARNEPTVPSSLNVEMQTNPFLRVADPALRDALNLSDEMTDEAVFAHLRKLKDAF